jgi:hypothetical protein
MNWRMDPYLSVGMRIKQEQNIEHNNDNDNNNMPRRRHYEDDEYTQCRL